MSLESESSSPAETTVQELAKSLHQLEARMGRLEAFMGVEEPAQPDADIAGKTVASTDDATLESQVGEYFLAQVGVVAMMAGIGFMIAYLYAFWPAWQAVPCAYLLVGSLLIASFLTRRTHPHISTTVLYGGGFLLYFTTLRLSFFSETPALSNRSVGLALLAALLVGIAVFAVLRKSQLLGGFAVFLGLATAVIADGVHFTLATILVSTVAAAFFRLRYDWAAVTVLGMMGAYAAHLIWLFGNPVLGHAFGMREEHHYNLAYLFGYCGVFVCANLFRSRKLAFETSNILLSLFNALGFYLISLMMVFKYWQPQAAAINLTIAGFFLVTGVAYWLYRKSFYSASLYALIGFFALSVTITVQYEGTERFVLLAWQSLLVVTLAIWFRSRLVTGANLLIYLSIYVFYLVSETPGAAVNLNYAAVGFVSARLLSWRRQQIDFGTGWLRTSYLTMTFFTLAYGLFLAVPAQFVSVAWLGASLLYFALSLVFKRPAYRWMGIVALLMTAGYVFGVDLAQLEVGYRIMSFLVVGGVLLIISLLYARRSRRTSEATEGAATETPDDQGA